MFASSRNSGERIPGALGIPKPSFFRYSCTIYLPLPCKSFRPPPAHRRLRRSRFRTVRRPLCLRGGLSRRNRRPSVRAGRRTVLHSLSSFPIAIRFDEFRTGTRFAPFVRSDPWPVGSARRAGFPVAGSGRLSSRGFPCTRFRGNVLFREHAPVSLPLHTSRRSSAHRARNAPGPAETCFSAVCSGTLHLHRKRLRSSEGVLQSSFPLRGLLSLSADQPACQSACHPSCARLSVSLPVSSSRRFIGLPRLTVSLSACLSPDLPARFPSACPFRLPVGLSVCLSARLSVIHPVCQPASPFQPIRRLRDRSTAFRRDFRRSARGRRFVSQR